MVVGRLEFLVVILLIILVLINDLVLMFRRWVTLVVWLGAWRATIEVFLGGSGEI